MGSLISYIQGGGPSEDLFLDFESTLPLLATAAAPAAPCRPLALPLCFSRRSPAAFLLRLFFASAAVAIAAARGLRRRGAVQRRRRRRLLPP